MTYLRRFVHYNRDLTVVKGTLNSSVTKAKFELLRRGGCGSGEIELKEPFTLRGRIEIGDWISMDYSASTTGRWYLGRVENVVENSPSTQQVHLYGPVVQLTELFPGGFAGADVDAPPALYAKSDYFAADPDRAYQTWDTVSQPWEVAELLYNRYILPRTIVGAKNIEAASPAVGLDTMAFRGEESVHAIMSQIALAENDAAWGVTQDGVFFLNKRRSNLIYNFFEGTNCESLSRKVDRSLLFNRMLFTGDYIYDGFGSFYRYRATWIQYSSRATYGERRIAIFQPWIRRNEDSYRFAVEFFRKYAQPTERITFTAHKDISTENPYNSGLSSMPRPWEGEIAVYDKDGGLLIRGPFEKIEVDFNHEPVFHITVGPEDVQFPRAQEPQRWELPNTQVPGGGGQPQPNPSIPSLPGGSGTSQSLSQPSLSSLPQPTLSSSGGPSSSGPSSSGPSSSGPSSSGPSSSGPSSSGPSSSGPSSSGPSSSNPSSSGTKICVEANPSDSATGGIFDSADAPWYDTGGGMGKADIDTGDTAEALYLTDFGFAMPDAKDVVGVTVIFNLHVPSNVATGITGGLFAVQNLSTGLSWQGPINISQTGNSYWPTTATDITHGSDVNNFVNATDTDDFDDPFRVFIVSDTVENGISGMTLTAHINLVTVRVCYDPNS